MAFVEFQNITTHKKRVFKQRVLTLSEADKLLREDVYSMAIVLSSTKKGAVNAVFYNDEGHYSFEVHNLTPADTNMLYKVYPLLYNYLNDIPF